MDKESVIFRLREIISQMHCMSEDEFNQCFQFGGIKFDYFILGTESEKIRTVISMEKWVFSPQEGQWIKEICESEENENDDN